MSESLPPARSFGSAAESYHRGRPSYPREVAAWLTAEQPLTVLELGAGTGLLTEALLDLGHDVHATDPDPEMLSVLRRRRPDCRTSECAAEELPLPDRSVDVVVAGQAFHWFDHARALPEVARVLKPGGRLSLVWNQRDERIPWVRRLGGVIGRQEQRDDLGHPLEATGLFGWVEEESFRHRQVIDRETVQDLALSRSHVLTRPESERERLRAEVLALYDEYGRGMDGMQLPYVARCFRARVTPEAHASLVSSPPAAAERPDDVAPGPAVAQDLPDEPRMLVTTGSIPRIEVEIARAPHAVVEDDDTAMLLIDFR